MPYKLQGLHVLVVEDEYVIAQMIADILEQAGCVVIGPAPALHSARELIGRTRIDSGLLDINLNGEMVFPLAEQLEQLKVPFVFITGYGSISFPERFRDCPSVAKPFTSDRLLRVLTTTISMAAPNC
jgi:two-component SAPR family response regulator